VFPKRSNIPIGQYICIFGDWHKPKKYAMDKLSMANLLKNAVF